MKELFENVINNREYELRDILNKIAERHINNDITDEDKTYLEELARNNANPVNSYAPDGDLIKQLFKRIEALEKVVFVETDEPVEDGEQVGGQVGEQVEKYPLYVQPTGQHDAYKVGDKITFNDKRYTCIMDNCVWDPSTYPNAWELVE